MSQEILTSQEPKAHISAVLPVSIKDSEVTPDELLTRTQLGYAVRQMLKERGLKKCEIAELLDIKQPGVSILMKEKYYLSSEGRLFGLLNKLNQKVIIQISQHHEGEPFQQVP